MSVACQPAIGEPLQSMNMGDGTSPSVDVSKAHENQNCNISYPESAEFPVGNCNASLGMHCSSDFYGRTSVYYCGGYNPPSIGWIDEHATGMGYDMSSFYPAIQGEDGSIMYYSSGYGYLQHCHQPIYCPQPPGTFVPNSAPVGHGYGPQVYPFVGALYQQPLPPGVQYYSSPSFDAKQDAPSWGFKKPGRACYSNGTVSYRSNEPKHGFHGLRSPSHGSPHSGSAPSLNLEDSQGGYHRTRVDFPLLSNTPGATREQVQDTSNGIQNQKGSRDLPASSHCLQPSTQEPQTSCTTTLLSEAQVKGPLVFPKTGLNSNDLGRKGHNNLGVKTEKLSSNLQGVNGNVNQSIESHDNSNDESQRPQVMKCKIQQTASHICVNEDYRSIPDNRSCINPTKEQYNKEGFRTTYSEAVFFIIKSYSEDDLHKSIKYSVWSSTPNGNKRLDGAYRVAQESTGRSQGCPVFLFFSVNSSGQFCGVAEMVGHVDFNRSMDFWLQGNWSGCFPVKWHIIKDVPNSQLRHIILANNDSKPVTHSRDTQQVKVEQGIEMLKIFKSFPLKTSLLDDFPFYDDRQRFLEARKLKRLQRQVCGSQKQVTRGLDQFDNGSCESPTDISRSEGKENGKIGQMQDINSSSPTCVSNETSDANNNAVISSKVLTEQSNDNTSSAIKNGNLVSDSEQDDLPMKRINYKRALMENVKGINNMEGNSSAV